MINKLRKFVEYFIREDIFDAWKKNYLFWKNKLYLSLKSSTSKEEIEAIIDEYFPFLPRTNKIPSDINVLLATYSSYPITCSVIPKGNSPEDIEGAKQLQNLINHFIIENKLDVNGTNFQKLIINAILYGVPALYVGYEMSDEIWILPNEEIANKVSYVATPITPFNFFYNPYIEDYSRQTELFIIREYDVDTARALFGSSISTSKFEYAFHSYVESNPDMVTIIEYFSKPKVVMKDNERVIEAGKHIIMDNSGKVIYEEDNYYEYLPVVYSTFYAGQGSYAGRSIMDEARIYETLRNILVSMLIENALRSQGYILAPEGAMEDVLELNPRKVLTYKIDITGRENKPELVSFPSIDSATYNLYSIIKGEKSEITTISPADYGRFSSATSGRAREIERASLEVLRYPNFVPIKEVYTLMTKKLISDVMIDHFKLFQSIELVKSLGTDGAIKFIGFSQSKIPLKAEYEVQIRYGDEAFPTKRELIGMAIQEAYSILSQDPNNITARQIIDEVYDRSGLGFLNRFRKKDMEQAEFENEIIKQLASIIELDYLLDVFSGKISFDEFIMNYGEQYNQAMKMLDAITPKVWENHNIHIQVHSYLVKTKEYIDYPRWLKIVLDEKLLMHYEMLGGAWNMPGNPLQRTIQKILKGGEENAEKKEK